MLKTLAKKTVNIYKQTILINYKYVFKLTYLSIHEQIEATIKLYLIRLLLTSIYISDFESF